MPPRNVVPVVVAILSTLLLLLGPAPTAAHAASARQVLLDARAKGDVDSAEVAKALQPVSPRTIAELRLLLGVRQTAESLLAAAGPPAVVPVGEFFFAEQLNEVAGTETAAPITVKFYSTVADNAQLPEETRRRAANGAVTAAVPGQTHLNL